MSDKPAEESSSTPEVPDDVWEQFARANEQAAPKEPSARARMVTDRLRQQEARGELPEGWRTGPAWREKKRGRGVWKALGVLLAAAVAVVAIKPSLLPGDPFGSGSADEAGGTLPAETAAPTGPPVSAAPGTPTLDDPFAGSPAKRWADGETGIVVPEAEAVGGRSKADVARALELTRKLLIDANLDPATLRGERPETALGLLEPHQDVPGFLKKALSKPDKAHDPLLMFSRFDPDEVRLVGDVVKTRGRITFKAGEGAAVAVHADYTFVYPVVRTDGTTEVARTIVRRVLDLELSDPAKYRVTPGKIAVVKYDQDIGNSACDVYDGFLHPHFDSAEPTGAAPTGPTTDPYDRSRDIGDDKGCGVVSRT
ncbi:hypothetical protein DI272_27740 [Streptomyces sp. Act143]|uniref:hypothetical protein n=1 Tax=Streptomyces sp. Act143 TaxID=2200760 RepID=UPI000D684605|nr:hypothetical protein [Streptomyces sp. Act143]PWI17532.1 hypothetical protein DI272_27740 [Streptomyces sp. Act143]